MEHPYNCWLWTMKRSLVSMKVYNRLEMVRFHSCCHGSKRKKDTGWLATPNVLTSLNATCQNATHMKLGEFLGNLENGGLILHWNKLILHCWLTSGGLLEEACHIEKPTAAGTSSSA